MKLTKPTGRTIRADGRCGCLREAVVGILDSDKPTCIGCLKVPSYCDCEDRVVEIKATEKQ